MEPRNDFKAGDYAIVTGDKAGWEHRFQPGEEVELLDYVKDVARDGTKFRCWRCQSTRAPQATWFVVDSDLEPVWTPASDEEISEAVNSIMRAV